MQDGKRQNKITNYKKITEKKEKEVAFNQNVKIEARLSAGKQLCRIVLIDSMISMTCKKKIMSTPYALIYTVEVCTLQAVISCRLFVAKQLKLSSFT